MNGRIVNLNASVHQTTQELLPWYVLGKLEGEERAQVREHLQICAQCMEEAEFQRKLMAIPIPDDTAVDVERALAGLRPQLTTQARNAPQREILSGRALDVLRNLKGAIGRIGPWMPWAMGTQFAAIAVLCVMLFQPERSAPEALYRGLGASVNVDGNIVVMFKPETTEQEIRSILHASGARMVDGPTVTDAYLLHVPVEQQARALAVLRRQSPVVLAESMESRGKP